MLILSIIAVSALVILGAVFFVECKVVQDLPDSNVFKIWWRANVIEKDLES